MNGGHRFCTNCGRRLSGEYSHCPRCGHTVRSNPNIATPPRPAPPSPYKSESSVLLLALLPGLFGLLGVGHLYLGRTGRGIKLLVSGLILSVIGWAAIGFLIALADMTFLIAIIQEDWTLTLVLAGIIPLAAFFALFAWQVVNAKKICREYNAYVQTHGRPPD